jgi:L-threonate 2-dehydrogenase
MRVISAPGPAGVLGVGQMGAAYVRALSDAGYEVIGFDISADRLAVLDDLGGARAASPRDLAERSSVVLTSLASIAALESAFFGADGLAAAKDPAAVVIETSTLPLEVKESARGRLAAIGTTLLDCPVSGTAAQAQLGDLAVFASGDAASVDACAPVFDAIGRTWAHVGPFGDGTRMKFVANLLIAVHNLAAGEALVLGMKAGLDPDLLYRTIASSAATSRMFEVSGPLIVERDYLDAGSKVSILHKDIGLIRDFATEVRAPVPLLAATAEYYSAAMALGMESWEDCSVAFLLERLAGLEGRLVGPATSEEAAG